MKSLLRPLLCLLATVVWLCALPHAARGAARVATPPTTPATNNAAAPALLELTPQKLRLTRKGKVWRGSFEVRNKGNKPLKVRVRLARGPHPRGMSVRLQKAGPTGSFGPGQSRRVLVQWQPNPAQRMDFHGYAVVEPVSPNAAQPLLQGFAADTRMQPIPFGGYLLSVLLFSALVAGATAGGLTTRLKQGKLRLAGMASAGLSALLAAWAANLVLPGLGRSDGGSFQLLERDLLGGGFEHGLALTGATAWLPLSLCVGVIGFQRSAQRFSPRDLVASGLLLGGSLAFVLGMGLPAFLLGAACLFAGLWAGLGEATTKRLAAVGAGSALLGLAIAIVGLWPLAHQKQQFLVTGEASSVSWHMPQWAELPLPTGRHLGMPMLGGAWLAWLLGCLAMAGILTLPVWLKRVETQAPSAIGPMAAHVVLPGILAGIAKVGLWVMPEAVVWSSAGLVVAGGALFALVAALLWRGVSPSGLLRLGPWMLSAATLVALGLGTAAAHGALWRGLLFYPVCVALAQNYLRHQGPAAVPQVPAVAISGPPLGIGWALLAGSSASAHLGAPLLVLVGIALSAAVVTSLFRGGASKPAATGAAARQHPLALAVVLLVGLLSFPLMPLSGIARSALDTSAKPTPPPALPKKQR